MPISYLQEVTLPSNGQFYDGKIPGGTVQVEPMGTREEKLFSSGEASGSSILDKLFSTCVKSPIPSLDLVLGDRLFLLLKIREVSYGDDYLYTFYCDECRSRSAATVNLSSLRILHPMVGSDGTFEVRLPLTGVQVKLRLLTGQDEEKVKQYARQLRTKQTVNVEGVEYVYRLARRIVSIDGKEDISIREAMEFVESLKGMDSVAVKDALDENEVGPDLEVSPICHCGYAVEPMTLPMTKEFFRPRRRSASTGDYLSAAEALDPPSARDVG